MIVALPGLFSYLFFVIVALPRLFSYLLCFIIDKPFQVSSHSADPNVLREVSPWTLLLTLSAKQLDGANDHVIEHHQESPSLKKVKFNARNPKYSHSTVSAKNLVVFTKIHK